MITLIIVILLLAAIGVLPIYPYSTTYGYGPSGVLGLILIVLVIWLLLGGRL